MEMCVLKSSEGLSCSDIDLACHDALKDAVLADRTAISAKDLESSFQHRHLAHP